VPTISNKSPGEGAGVYTRRIHPPVAVMWITHKFRQPKQLRRPQDVSRPQTELSFCWELKSGQRRMSRLRDMSIHNPTCNEWSQLLTIGLCPHNCRAIECAHRLELGIRSEAGHRSWSS